MRIARIAIESLAVPLKRPYRIANQTTDAVRIAFVRVEAENLTSGLQVHTSSAYLVFVALDEDGKPRRVPSIEPKTEVERQRQVEAKLRRENRLARAAAIRAARDPDEPAITRADHGRD